MTEDLRGVFYITRGNYRRDKSPRFYNEVTESYQCIGGYNPEDETNEQWYGLYDNLTFTCHCATSDLEKVKESLFNHLVKYKTRGRFLETMRSLTFGRAGGGQARLEQEIYDTYGDFFRDTVEEIEDRAYEEIRKSSPVLKARNTKLRRKVSVEMVTPNTTPETTNTPAKTTLKVSENKTKKKGLKPVKRKVSVEMS